MSCPKQMRRLVSTHISSKLTLIVLLVYMCIFYTVTAMHYVKEQSLNKLCQDSLAKMQ